MHTFVIYTFFWKKWIWCKTLSSLFSSSSSLPPPPSSSTSSSSWCYRWCYWWWWWSSSSCCFYVLPLLTTVEVAPKSQQVTSRRTIFFFIKWCKQMRCHANRDKKWKKLILVIAWREIYRECEKNVLVWFLQFAYFMSTGICSTYLFAVFDIIPKATITTFNIRWLEIKPSTDFHFAYFYFPFSSFLSSVFKNVLFFFG